MEKTPKDQVKFYADAPNGILNKLCCYKVYDLMHSIDLLNRFVNKGWKIRAAYHQYENGKNKDLKAILPTIKGDITTTYSNLKIMDEKADKFYKQLKAEELAQREKNTGFG